MNKQVLILALIVAIVALACNATEAALSTPAVSSETASQPSTEVQLVNVQAQAFAFPDPEELVAYGVLSKPRAGRPPKQWGWGEYGFGPSLPPLVGSTTIAQGLGSLMSGAMFDYTNPESRHGKPFWEQTVDQETVLALKQLTERLFVPSPPESIGYFDRREIYSMRFEPDYSVKPVVKTMTKVWTSRDSPPEQVEYPYLSFSSFVTITFEGETGKETVRLRVRSAIPYLEVNPQDFQIRILE